MKSLKITKYDEPGSSRKGQLHGLTVAEITAKLGFAPNVEDDPDKVVNSWGFKINKISCGIWDYKGSHNYGVFSFDGPQHLFVELFGSDKVKYDY